MLNCVRIKSDLPIEPLLAQIDQHSYLWDQITARQDHPLSYHKATRSIFLRWSKEQSIEAAFTDLVAVDYPAILDLPAALELILETEHVVDGKELGRVLIVDLKPGGVIPLHADEGAYADHFERFHICLSSDPGNVFLIESVPGCGEYVHMQRGELWNFNHKAKHMLFNGSKSNRVHLIIDMVAPKYRRERV